MSDLPLWLVAYAAVIFVTLGVGVSILGTWFAYCYVHTPGTLDETDP